MSCRPIPFLNNRFAKALGGEEGQTIVEYALMIVLVALAVLLSNPSLTSAILKVFEDTSSLLGYRP